MKELELTILLPVLNEERTLEICINKANKFIEKYNISAEILISDNGSTDNSRNIAKDLGARIIDVVEKGYGNTLTAGINSARGKYIIMADADDSYDLENLEVFWQKLQQGYELVIGNRFKGRNRKRCHAFST